MSIKERLVGVVVGLLVVALLVAGGFAVVGQLIPTWGATPAQVARTIPGDELIPNATVNWIHVITSNAPAAQVWG